MVVWLFVFWILTSMSSFFHWQFWELLKMELHPPQKIQWKKCKKHFLKHSWQREVFFISCLEELLFFLPHSMFFCFPSYCCIWGVTREKISGFPAVRADKEINNASCKLLRGTKTVLSISLTWQTASNYDKSLVLSSSWSTLVSTSHPQQIRCLAKHEFGKTIF